MLLNKHTYTNYKHFLSLIIFLFFTLWFVYLKKTIVPKHIMYSYIDFRIPFVKEFVLAYYFWFIYGYFLYLGFTSKIDFYRMELFLLLGMIISLLSHPLFQTLQRHNKNTIMLNKNHDDVFVILFI